jgi:hypothetical protein
MNTSRLGASNWVRAHDVQPFIQADLRQLRWLVRLPRTLDSTMRKALLLGIAMLWSAAMFTAGAMYREDRALAKPFVVTHPLGLQLAGPSQLGQLPAGSTVYRVDGSGEPTFAVYFTTKELTSLQPKIPDRWLEREPLAGWALR